MAPRIDTNPKTTTNRDCARTCLSTINQAPEIDDDTVVIAALGIGYALLDIAEAFRERNQLISEMLKPEPR